MLMRVGRGTYPESQGGGPTQSPTASGSDNFGRKIVGIHMRSVRGTILVGRSWACSCVWGGVLTPSHCVEAQIKAQPPHVVTSLVGRSLACSCVRGGVLTPSHKVAAQIKAQPPHEVTILVGRSLACTCVLGGVPTPSHKVVAHSKPNHRLK